MSEGQEEGRSQLVASLKPSPPVTKYTVGQRWSKGGQVRTILVVGDMGHVTYKSFGRKVTVSPESWRRWIETGYMAEKGAKATLDFDPNNSRQAAHVREDRPGPQEGEWDCGPNDCDDNE